MPKRKIPALTLAQAKREILRMDALRLQEKLRADQNAKHKDQGFAERNALIAALSRLYEAHLMPNSQTRLNWTWVVCIHTPAGQLAWTLPDDALDQFAHLGEPVANHWDGCNTTEKYNRLSRLHTVPAEE